MSIRLARRTALTFLIVGFCIGLIFQKFYGLGRVMHAVGLDYELIRTWIETARGKRTAVPLAALESKQRLMVAVVFGQSNSANTGETPKGATGDVYNFYRGTLYRAEDPLLGAEGTGGSVWTRLGDQLIERNLYDAVVFAPLGVSDSEIARWQSIGDLHQSILGVIQDLQKHHLAITHLLWHQGESDAKLKTSAETYKGMFLDMLASIRRHGVEAPVFVSIATRCGKNRGEPYLQRAQADLVNIAHGIYPGPNTDTLGLAYRIDGCHFSDEGLEQTARLWLDAFESSRKSGEVPQQIGQRQGLN
jgi:carbohydrate esterase-like sialic acid-specific acetylesterase